MSKTSTSEKSLTDWKRLEEMKDEDIDISDIPPLTPDMFAKAVVKQGLKPKDTKAQSASTESTSQRDSAE
jgi:hypothetical protein